MEILAEKDGILVQKEDGTKVIYHIFTEHEIHFNEVPSHTTQLWHHHKVIEENIFIISGEMEVQWKEDNEFHSKKVTFGNLIRVENTLHTLVNSSDNSCSFIVFRFLPTGVMTQQIIKNDKYIDLN